MSEIFQKIAIQLTGSSGLPDPSFPGSGKPWIPACSRCSELDRNDAPEHLSEPTTRTDVRGSVY